jgi:hypothetical protein
VLGKFSDLAVVGALLVINAVLSFMQEQRAQDSGPGELAISAVSGTRDLAASEVTGFWRNSHAFTGFPFNIDRGNTRASTNEEERNRYEDIDGSYFAQRVGEYGKEDRLLAGRIRNSLFRVPRCGSRYHAGYSEGRATAT